MSGRFRFLDPQECFPAPVTGTSHECSVPVFCAPAPHGGR